MKNTKHNKTPGIDGLPSEFLKVFWSRLKFFILKALNHSYNEGILPVSLRQCVITCLPKGNKSRDNIKNWRPISLLSVTYKLASSAISNRIKKVLNILVSETQSGFIPGRNISDCTRLIYDIMHHVDEKNQDGLLLLIDFEKAFDSISWRFMYRVLSFLGFKNGLINWIKLFNTEVKASVIQCGILSEFFNISSGARQGDPIAAYVFILCAQILHLLIQSNTNIKGIKIHEDEYKMTQFADDTTLILDGSVESLRSALNVLEVFGSLSGLKVNKLKTKVVWIGRKKLCKEKLDVGIKLDWNCIKFDLLGITFHVNLNEMVSINYENVFPKIRNLMSNWEKRCLTPIGKIVIIKTFLLTNFNHLFVTLPTPSTSVTQELNNVLYKYLWDNKPDKINRIQISQDYLNGGLKMINVLNFIKAIKTTWIRRILQGGNQQWLKLLESSIFSTNKIAVFGPQWCIQIKSKISNKFWKSVLESWIDISNAYKPVYFDDILSSPLWYNHLISPYTMYLSKWFQKGIYIIGDILTTTNNEMAVLSFEDLKKQYNFPNMNILDYYRIRGLVNNFVKLYDVEHKYYARPHIPHHIKILLKNTKGARDMYNVINSSNTEPSMKRKWNRDLEVNLNQYSWKSVFKICFKTIQDPLIVWTQYRILFRILGTREQLYLFKISESPNCRLCNNQSETLIHMFVECEPVKHLWMNVQSVIKENTGIEIPIDKNTIILGYMLNDASHKSINTIILTTKCYIFQCFRKAYNPNLNTVLKYIKKVYNEQICLAKINDYIRKFEKQWQKMLPFIDPETS